MTPEREKRLRDVIAKRQPDLSIVLENVEDPHNISAVMRTADSVGVQDIYILNTKIPRHKSWGVRSSSSAAKWLSVHEYEDATACFEALRARHERIFATYLSGGALDLYQMDFTKSTALVFGNEHSGVSDEIRALADDSFVIPQVGIIQSLNISVACAVTLYEAFRQKTLAGHYDGNDLTGDYKIALQTQWGLPG